jgi:hypothetical protein
MRSVVGFPVAVAQFLYRFIVGDDWVVAVVMILALAATGVLQAQHFPAWWLVPVLAIVMTGISLLRSMPQQSPIRPTPARSPSTSPSASAGPPR